MHLARIMHIHLDKDLDEFRFIYVICYCQVLRGTCFHCQQLRCLPATMYMITAQLKALEMGLAGLVAEFQDIFHQLVAVYGGPREIYDELKDSIATKFAAISESKNCFQHYSIKVSSIMYTYQH
eukprot:GHVU01090435.1.p1 GENE.GHVU01090435.1~~GHVU01090435.1.p1  ORF type:complete len:124 (+),score=9.86 GHVU01090435.1:183-554(+)